MVLGVVMVRNSNETNHFQFNFLLHSKVIFSCVYTVSTAKSISMVAKKSISTAVKINFYDGKNQFLRQKKSISTQKVQNWM